MEHKNRHRHVYSIETLKGENDDADDALNFSYTL